MVEPTYPVKLSIIIPCLNEESTLPLLFHSLSGQQGIDFEIIICDGGSLDGTLRTASRVAADHGLRIRSLTCEKGRGRQLNAGIGESRGRYLLILHADSRFEDDMALSKAVAMLDSFCLKLGTDAVAGHFALRFERQRDDHPLGYYFYECKASLGRRECIHGDQGLLIPSSFLQRAGPVPIFPPMLAETMLAERIRAMGVMLLLPAFILSSARRFEAEGLYQRQVVNAILMNCAFLGWEAPFKELAGAYRSHTEAGTLSLAPFLDGIHRLIRRMPCRERRAFWYGTGRYVRLNAWQLAFFLDVRRNYQSRIPAGQGPTRILELFDRWIEPLIDNPPCRILAALATWIWFHLTRVLSR